MPLATLTSKGQLTIPKEIRDHLNVDSGDKLEFIINADGSVSIAAKTLDIDDIFGKFSRKKNISIASMNNTIKQRSKKN